MLCSKDASATCSLDQLLRVLTWFGDDWRFTSGPDSNAPNGALRVLQAAAVAQPDDFEPVRPENDRRLVMGARSMASSSASQRQTTNGVDDAPATIGDYRQLLNKHAVEQMTSLDITTIYHRMRAGTFPQPVRMAAGA